MGNMQIDTNTTAQLLQDKKFIQLNRKAEENEHSLEMHLPYIYKVFSDAGNTNFQLLPMMVGQVKNQDMPKYAESLKPLFMDNKTLFVISSDFCHWGDNFDYKPIMSQFKDKGSKYIHKSIEALDKWGMDLIEKHDLAGF